MWRSHQREVAAAILGGDRTAGARIAERATGRFERALAVHRSTTIETLTEALANAYPSVRRTLGAARFRALAEDHVRTRPPRRPDLWSYGRDLPERIAARHGRSAPVGLADVARIDRAWLEAYHAAEAPPLAPATMVARMGGGRPLATMLHPSVRLLALDAGNLARWRALAADPGHEDRDEPGADGRHALVARPEATVLVVSLAPGTAALLDAVADGCDLIEAFARASAAHPGIDAEPALTTLFAAGVFADDPAPGRRTEG
ncbi:MAG: DNA-binding domain-containing protein [Alphaproteobacteria bacterium]